jgi:hypothetical protein
MGGNNDPPERDDDQDDDLKAGRGQRDRVEVHRSSIQKYLVLRGALSRDLEAIRHACLFNFFNLCISFKEFKQYFSKD